LNITVVVVIQLSNLSLSQFSFSASKSTEILQILKLHAEIKTLALTLYLGESDFVRFI